MSLPSNRSCNTTREPDYILQGMFRQLSMDLGLWENEEVTRAYGLLTSRKYLQFLHLTDSWSRQQYATSGEHRRWNQLACLLKKYPFEDPLIDKEAAAWEKFLAAEHSCKRLNQRFRARRARLVSPPYELYVHRARRYIRSIIGETPNFDRIWDMCDFGPGSAVGVHGPRTHSATKLSGKWSVTPAAVPYAIAALSRNAQVWELVMGSPTCYDFGMFSEKVKGRMSLVDYNKIVFVPKTAKVHRTIAMEPLLNGFVQKGVDNYLRGKLARVGIDLSDQGRNQNLALSGSCGGFNPFSTIDLSAASDSISKELVRELLPPDWFNFLNAIRSPRYESSRGSGRYEKFTSMGNGFCFPLETLIFASIVHSVYAVTGDSEFAVYGDDIIVRQSSALLVLEVLKYVGFDANLDKTFIFGPFRESCGADFFEGVNVRPYYVDEIPRKAVDVFKWLNGISQKWGYDSCWEFLLGVIHPEWHLFRPHPGPDDSITVPVDRFMSSRYCKWNRDEQRWSWLRCLTIAVFDKEIFSPPIQMYGLLRGAQSNQGTMQFTLRRKTRTRLAYT
ncbi:MAG: RNA replicase beta chain [Sanya solspi-like virus 4]|nr:MAG: RNA replicase beta chain [Sanya solspi-like virus 4]